jgi:aldehyde:ferredoxin oxidoreductase
MQMPPRYFFVGIFCRLNREGITGGVRIMKKSAERPCMISSCPVAASTGTAATPAASSSVHRVCVGKAGGAYTTSGFEYETVWGLGADAMIEDLDDIARYDHIMDEIGRGASPGRILGNSTASVGKAYGLVRVPVVKGRGIPAYDPRAIKGFCHLSNLDRGGRSLPRAILFATNILKVGGFGEPLQKEGQVELSRNLQIATAAVDSTGMYVFLFRPSISPKD